MNTNGIYFKLISDHFHFIPPENPWFSCLQGVYNENMDQKLTDS